VKEKQNKGEIPHSIAEHVSGCGVTVAHATCMPEEAILPERKLPAFESAKLPHSY